MSISTSPTQGFAPLTVDVTIHIAANAANKDACLIIYSEGERGDEHLDCWTIDDRTPTTHRWVRGLSAGTYLFSLAVGRAGESKPLYSTPKRVFSREVEEQ